MSIDPQNLNTTLFRNPYYVVQKQENEHRLRHKKKLDDQIMDNVLKINLLIFLVCLLIISLFFLFDAEIVVFIPKQNDSKIIKYLKKIKSIILNSNEITKKIFSRIFKSGIFYV